VVFLYRVQLDTSLAREKFFKLLNIIKMDLSNLIQTNANINLTITLDDLRTFTNELIQKTKNELEAVIIADKAEINVPRLEACEVLKVDQSTLFRWAKRGYLVPVEVGGKRMYKMSDLKQILNGGGLAK
jgi:hypothetical protein